MKIRKLTLHNFKKYYLQDDYILDLTINDAPASIIAISGRNAAGKTTIADAICFVFTKKTYEDESLDVSNLTNIDNVSVTCEFEINNTIHTLTRTITPTFKGNSYSTILNGKVIKETSVATELKNIGLNGIDNFLVCIHPLYLIDPVYGSKSNSIKLFYNLMKQAANKELSALVANLKTKTYYNEALKTNEPLFNDVDLYNFTDPVQISDEITRLSNNTKSYTDDLKKANEDYQILKENLSVLSDDEIKELQALINNNNTLINRKLNDKIRYDTLINNIKLKQAEIVRLQNSIKVYEQDNSMDAISIKNRQLKTELLAWFENFKTALTNLVDGLEPLIQTKHEQLIKWISLNLSNDSAIEVLKQQIINAENAINSYQKELDELDLVKINKITEETTILRQQIANYQAKLLTNSQNSVQLKQGLNKIELLKQSNYTAAKNLVKISVLKTLKDDCLNLMTKFVNDACKRVEINLFSYNAKGDLVNDFVILSKTNHLPFSKLNKAEQWLCGFELAMLFQSYNDLALPIIFDGAESIDTSQKQMLFKTFVEIDADSAHQLIVLNVKNDDLKVSLV